MDSEGKRNGGEEPVEETSTNSSDLHLPAHHATSAQHEPVDAGTPTNNPKWIPPLSYPAEPDVNANPSSLPLRKAFLEAIKQDNVPTVSSFLSTGLDIELETEYGFTPLVLALRSSSVETTSLLLQRGASVHRRSNRLPPLVHAAMSATHGPALMQLLLSHGAILTGTSGPDGKNVLHWAAAEGVASSVDFLVKQVGIDVETRCTEGCTAMVLAAQAGHEQVVKVLWACGAELEAQSENGGTPLIWAVCKARNEVVKFLLGKGVDVDKRDGLGHTALFLASHFGDAEIVDLLLAAGADVDARSEEPKRRTPLMAAACSNAAVVAKALIAGGADVHAKAANGDSVLDLALLQGSQQVVDLLLEALGGDDHPKESVALQFAMARDHVTIKSLTATASMMHSCIEPGQHNKHAWIDWVLNQGGDLVKPMAMTKLLHTALRNDDVDMVKCVVSYSCDVNRKLDSGMTPLAYAVSHRLLDLVEILLEAGADPNEALPESKKPGSRSITPFDYAIINMVNDVDVKMVELLLNSRRCRINQGKDVKNTAFSFVLTKTKAPETKDDANDLARRMIDSIPDVDADRDDNGFTLLHVATFHQDLGMIDFLLNRGADIEAIAIDGTTPFLLACQKDPVIAMELLQRGANIKAKIHKTNSNALHAMAAYGLSHFPMFCELGLDINEQTLKGYTPLACGLDRGHGSLSCNLMDWGATVSWKTNRNLTALHLAARNGLDGAVEKILQQDVDVNAVDTQGWTSLHEACATGTSRVVTQLLDAGADIERPLPSGDTPLHVALTTENEEIALLLLERGANVSTRASKNRTSLHLAAYHSLPRVAEKLLRLVEPATIHAADEEIRTPLCYAEHPGIVKMLISAGAEVDYIGRDGWTALHHAIHNGDAEAAMILVYAGANLETRTTDDGLSVKERVVDMWDWSDKKRRVVHPGLLKKAEMQRDERMKREMVKAAVDEAPKDLLAPHANRRLALRSPT